jgi:rhodanese-related sulfurtransferase
MEPKRISAAEAKALFDRGGVAFLDTRSAESWGEADAQIPGSIRVPPDAVAEHLDEIPRGRTAVTYCT